MLDEFSWKVTSSDRKKLILFIKDHLKTDVSNKLLKKAIEKGLCKVNGKIELFYSHILKTNDAIQFHKHFDKFVKEKKSKPKILYEDDYFIAINKPANLICEDQYINEFFPKTTLIHRLDKNTTGVLLLSKSKSFKEKMKKLFRGHLVNKFYLAIVDKKIKFKTKKIENFLIKKKKQSLWKSSSKGLYSLSYIECLKTKKDISLVQCQPITGRTHQLRVHLSEIGHPILGDYQYVQGFIYPHYVSRYLLHSYKIAFDHPSEDQKIVIQAPYPDDFKKFFKTL